MTGVVLHAAPAGGEADSGGVRAKRCIGIRLPRWHQHPNKGNNTRYCGSCTQRKLPNIGIGTNPRKTVARPPRGHVPTPKKVALLDGIGVGIDKRSGANVVGVPVGTD